MAGVTATSPAALSDHLAALGIGPGMDVVVHSKLISFGRIEGGADTVLACLRAAVGPGGTLAFPSYTFGDADTVYDPASSPCSNVGLLSQRALREAGAVRSRCPIHNHVALGPRADVLAPAPIAVPAGAGAGPATGTGDGAIMVSFGPGSDFERLHRAGFELLLLGCNFDEGCTFLHHMEAVMATPYRQWRELPRRVRDPADGREQAVTCRYYGFRDQEPATRFGAVIAPLRASGALAEAAAPYGRSYRVGLDSLYRCAEHLLRNDPLALIIPGAAP